MTFESFVKTYSEDMQSRLKENTWHTKEHIIRTKILPYFGRRKMNDIQPKDIIAWQNEMINTVDKNGKSYSAVYLKTVHNQLSAIFNHAVKYYGLSANPVSKVGNMGKAKSKEMQFWTQEEYKKFSYEMIDKPVSYYAFEILYWCGIREGELLALTPSDFDFELDSKYQEKQTAIEKADEALSEKNSKLVEVAEVLANNQALLKSTAEKITKIKDIDSIETGKTVFGDKITILREDYVNLTDLAKKQIAVENNESKLFTEVESLKRRNSDLVNENVSLKNEVKAVKSLSESLKKPLNDVENWKNIYHKALIFWKNLV